MKLFEKTDKQQQIQKQRSFTFYTSNDMPNPYCEKKIIKT